jgi:hypothetical protein
MAARKITTLPETKMTATLNETEELIRISFPAFEQPKEMRNDDWSSFLGR